MARGAEADRTHLHAHEADTRAEPDPARRARILCVDDEPGVLTILSRALGSQFEIVTMDDPLAALALLDRRRDFAVVISDLQMPQMDGADFLARAKQLAPTSSRLALTGSLDRELDVDQVFGILTKPCPIRLLHESVMAAVQHHLLLAQPDSRLPEPPVHELGSMHTAPPDHADLVSGIRQRRSRRRLEVDGAARPVVVELAEPDGAISSPVPDALDVDAPGALVLLAAVANKFFMLGQPGKAERLVRASLEDLGMRACHGLVQARDAETAVTLAMRLAEELREPDWIDYVFRLYLHLRRPLTPIAIERMHVLVRQVPGASRSRFREYLEMLHDQQGALGVADQFLLRRIEGLEPLFRQ